MFLHNPGPGRPKREAMSNLGTGVGQGKEEEGESE